MIINRRQLMIGALLASLSAIAYSTNTPLSPIVFAGGGSAMFIIFLRAFGAVVLSSVLLPLQASGSQLTNHVAVTLFLSVFLFAQGAFYVASVAHIPVSLAALIFFTWPVWVGLFSAVTSRGEFSWLTLSYFFVALFGLAIALQADFGSLDVRGVLCAFMGAISMASYVLFAARLLPRDAGPLTLNIQINTGIAIFALLSLLLLGETGIPEGRGSIGALIAIAGFFTVATLTQILAIRAAGGPLAALFFYIEPVASIGLAVLVLNESFGLQQILGGAIVVGTLVAYALRGFVRARG